MASTLADLLMTPPPTPERPLLGVMILAVEDSRYSSDALRLICQRSGARVRRAESLASARRHLRAYRPRVAIVDLGLPDGSGLSLISQLARSEPRIEVLIAVSGDDSRTGEAIAAGADIFLAKPITSAAAFVSTVLGLLPTDDHPDELAVFAEDRVAPDPMALRDDLLLVVDLLRQEDDRKTLDYATGFLKSLARECAHGDLADLGEKVASLAAGGGEMAAPGRIADRLLELIGSTDEAQARTGVAAAEMFR